MSEFLAEAQVLIVPNTAAFAASLKAQLAAAVAEAGPVVIPVAAAPLATGTGKALAAETAITTTAIKAETTALQVEGAAATKTAVSQAQLARAEHAATVAHSQATRGIAAETLALTGLRGATLAASAPFLVGATAAIIFAKSIQEASDQTEELNKVGEVFGQSADEIKAFASTTATALGISETEALRSTAIFGNLFRAIQISEPVAAAMSVQLVKLAADLASFNNASPERTLEALRAGLVGQPRPLRVFGAFLTAARVQQEALIETGKKSVKQLSEAEKVQARYNLILQDTVLAQGDVTRTAEGLANQSRILKAQLANVSGEIGKVLIPAVLLAVQDVNLLIQAFDRLSSLRIKVPGSEKGGSLDLLKEKVQDIFGERQSKDLLLNILAPGLGSTANSLELLNFALKKLLPAEDQTTEATKHLNDAMDAGARAARLAAFAIVSAQVAVQDLGGALKGLEIEQLKIQTGLAPGGRGAEEANLRKQIAADKEVVALSKSGTKARRDALIQLKSDQDELESLLSQDASDAEARVGRIRESAAKQKQAAQDAAQAQAEATQAFIDQFSGKQERLDNKLTSAQLSGNTTRQIAINKALIQADKNEINAIKDRIRHLHLHGDALRIALATIKALNQEIFNTRNAILSLQAERKQALTDARQSHLESILAIAETTASTRDDIAAEKALIKFDQAQIRRILAIKRRRRLTLDEAAQLDAYRVDLAQRNAALKETTEEQKKGRTFAQAAFEFLQQQQGFAANLLGNLIPSGATAGLVGGASQAGVSAIRPPGVGVAQESQIAAGKDVGFSAGQGNTTNELLRQIRDALKVLNGSQQAPEARTQRVMQSGSAHYGGV